MLLVRNPEAARLVRAFAVLCLLATLLALGLSLGGLYYFRAVIARNNAAVVGAAIAKSPEAENTVIRQILNADAETIRQGQAALARYGVDNRGFWPETTALRDAFWLNTGFYLALTVLLCGLFIWLTLRFLERQYAQIRTVAAYAGKIASGDYSLDIRDNAEGDISLLKNEIYKITTMLKTQAETLQQEKAALASALADISHQLKTPLTSLFVLNDLLGSDPAPAVRTEFLSRMKAQLERIEWLVVSLLKLARFDAGTVVLKQEAVRVKALVGKALAALDIPIDIKQLRVDVAGEPDSTFTGDLNWTCEALINILKNCIEHTPEKGQIDISFSENQLFTTLSVRDSGAGIAKEDLPYIFNRFYKGKNAGPDSVGIGLAMAQAIVAGQGGDITVRSESGKGTEFTLKFFKGVI